MRSSEPVPTCTQPDGQLESSKPDWEPTKPCCSYTAEGDIVNIDTGIAHNVNNKYDNCINVFTTDSYCHIEYDSLSAITPQSIISSDNTSGAQVYTSDSVHQVYTSDSVQPFYSSDTPTSAQLYSSDSAQQLYSSDSIIYTSEIKENSAGPLEPVVFGRLESPGHGSGCSSSVPSFSCNTLDIDKVSILIIAQIKRQKNGHNISKKSNWLII